jgi:centromere protein S
VERVVTRLTDPPQRLKSALWYAIGQFVDDALLADDLNATPQFIGALTELVYTQIGTQPRLQ